MNTFVLPQLGGLFRAAVTRAGYRPRLADLGLDKDLDDLALETRQGSSAELLFSLEDAVQRELAKDSGEQWAQVLRWSWGRTREAIQGLVREVETTPIATDAGSDTVRDEFVVPMLAGLVGLVAKHFPGIDLEVWWRSPFAAWVKLAAAVGQLPEAEVVARVHDTPRTTERWLTGETVGDLHFPFRHSVLRVLCGSVDSQVTGPIDKLTGWLTFTVAFQSLPMPVRESIRRAFELRKQQPWSVDAFVAKLQRQSLAAGVRPIRDRVIPLLQQIERHFSGERDLEAAGQCVARLQDLIDQEPPFWRESYQYIHDWFGGRLAALHGRQDDAQRLYKAAVDGAWWRGGPNQHPILSEALLYAVGAGDLVAAKRYWDQTFMIGLNRWPKRPLDEQERRRLAFAFEEMFAPQLAKDRIPPRTETIVRDAPFELSAEQLKNPNRKVKHAEGRSRRTPLMDAVREGTLAEVKRAIAAGGDPNDFIKESGEGPLTYAMRRACDRRDALIMDHLLQLDLLPETVNRQASTSRETPLKIAIEMADASAVERLIILGADVEQVCDYVPSALCFAMSLLHGSMHRDDKTQEIAYLTGRTRADVHDAKHSAALDFELAARRQRQLALRDASPRNQALFDAVMNWFIRPPDAHRRVVKALLRLGANPNRRYKVEHEQLAEWTPTLFAAQVGDLGVFESMVNHGGDPELVLMESSSLDRQDAMWVAIQHGRHAVVDFLVKRARKARAE